jgi:hypothetical protein
MFYGTVELVPFQIRRVPAFFRNMESRTLTLQLLTARRKSCVLSKRERVSLKRHGTSQLFLAQLTEAGHRPV